jgi:hypothetical protein
VNNNKVIALVVGGVVALFALWMVVRIFIVSQYGFGASPIFYLGLPIGAIVTIVLLLLRLGLLNFGDRPGGHPWQRPGGWQTPPQPWQQPGAQVPPQPWQQPGAQVPPQPWQQPGAQLPPQPWQQPGVQLPAQPAQPWQQPVQPPPPAVSPPVAAVAPPTASVAQRLQELETLRATGAISDTEYTAKRQKIISEM